MTNILAPEQEPLPPKMNGHSYTNESMTFDIRSRYWTFLFDNLKRSIEQIYQTCESDQNILQCQVCYREISSKELVCLVFIGNCTISVSLL